MLTASQSLGRAVESGRPLPEVPALDALYRGTFRCRPRQGQVMLLAGQPKSLKSAFALFWVSEMNLPSLYMCADMAPHTATTRLAACITGDTTDEVSEGLAGAGEAYYAEALEASRVRFCFDPNPTLETIYGEIDAWVELNDSYPQVIVIDNLMDVLAEGDNELTVQKTILLEAKTIARETGAAVIVLHHMTESVGDSTKPSPRKALMNKVSQTPEVVLSVAIENDEFKISVVANRNGRQDAAAKEYVSLRVIPERNRFEPWVAAPAIPIPNVPDTSVWWKD